VLVSAVGVALKEALSCDFKVYQQQVIDNAKALCTALQKKGFTIVSGMLNSTSLICIFVIVKTIWSSNRVSGLRLFFVVKLS